MRISWRDYAVAAPESRALEDALAGLGVVPGHRVGILTGNTPLHVLMHIGARRAGWSLVPLAVQKPVEAIAAEVMQGIDAIVCGPDEAPWADRITGSKPLVVCDHWGVPTRVQLGVLAAAQPPPAEMGLVHVRTSGTTGAARRVALTQSMLAAHAAASRARLGAATAWLGVLPLRHVGGVTLVDRCIRDNLHLVLEERFDAARFGRLLGQHNVSHASLVPTMLQRLRSAGVIAPSTLKCVLLGGDAANEELVQSSIALGWPIHCTYGLTEACGQVATATPDERVRRPGTSGRPLADVKVKLVQGEIVVNGPTVLGGEVHTGDFGRIDSDGFLFVDGRMRDVIVTGGEKVIPAEVEQILLTHPAVAEACVVGLPDAEWGHRVAAAVVERTAITDDELVHYCRERLPPHHVPKSWLRLDRLPRTDSGKLKRAVLQAAWP